MQVADEFIKKSERTKRPRTVDHIKYGLGKFTPNYGLRKIAGISPQDFKDFTNALFDAGHTVNGINIIMSAVAACFGYAIESRYIRNNPAKSTQMEPKKVAKYLSKATIKTLLDKGCAFNKELRQLVLIALYSGMRQGEILGVKPESVRNGFIRLEDTKTGNPRLVPIHPVIAPFLKDSKWIAKWDRNRIGRAFRRAVARITLGRIRFHDLRHTFCSNYLQSGGTLADLREISGHRTLRMLQAYAHFQPNYLKERMEKFTLV